MYNPNNYSDGPQQPLSHLNDISLQPNDSALGQSANTSGTGKKPATSAQQKEAQIQLIRLMMETSQMQGRDLRALFHAEDSSGRGSIGVVAMIRVMDSLALTQRYDTPSALIGTSSESRGQGLKLLRMAAGATKNIPYEKWMDAARSLKVRFLFKKYFSNFYEKYFESKLKIYSYNYSNSIENHIISLKCFHFAKIQNSAPAKPELRQ